MALTLGHGDSGEDGGTEQGSDQQELYFQKVTSAGLWNYAWYR